MITLNGDEIPQQPNKLNENPSSVKTDTFAIDGTPSRMQLPSKGRASMLIKTATPETFRFIKALYDAASPVTYVNTSSNVTGGVLEFTGIIDFNEEDYIGGGSLMVPLQVTIMEGSVVEA